MAVALPAFLLAQQSGYGAVSHRAFYAMVTSPESSAVRDDLLQTKA